VPNLTFGPPVVRCLRRHDANFFFDCHLMVSSPRYWVKSLHEAAANQITFHLEATEGCEEATDIATLITSLGMMAGISVRPKTPIQDAFPALDSGLFSTLLIMTVEPGFGGQAFDLTMLPKIAIARKRYPNIVIEVDGGIDENNVKLVAAEGANAIVAGTSIFRSEDPASVISNMRKALSRKHEPQK